MRRRAFAVILVGGMALAACSSVGGSGTPEAAAPAWSPAGTWSFSTTAQGMTVGGTITLVQEGGTWGGTIAPDASLGMGSFPIDSAELDGREMRLLANAMGDVLDMVMVFDGDTYEGSWGLGGDGGSMSGRRLN